jgi:hypothetical protein
MENGKRKRWLDLGEFYAGVRWMRLELGGRGWLERPALHGRMRR